MFLTLITDDFYQKSYFIIGLFEISLSVSKLLLFAGIFVGARDTLHTDVPVGGGSRGFTGGVESCHLLFSRGLHRIPRIRKR